MVGYNLLHQWWQVVPSVEMAWNGSQTLCGRAIINESNIPSDTYFKPEWRLATLVRQHILQFWMAVGHFGSTAHFAILNGSWPLWSNSTFCNSEWLFCYFIQVQTKGGLRVLYYWNSEFSWPLWSNGAFWISELLISRNWLATLVQHCHFDLLATKM